MDKKRIQYTKGVNMQKNGKTYAERQKEAKARYIAEKTDMIAAHLPAGYKEKINKISKETNTSKAQTIKNAVDMLYKSIFGDE